MATPNPSYFAKPVILAKVLISSKPYFVYLYLFLFLVSTAELVVILVP